MAASATEVRSDNAAYWSESIFAETTAPSPIVYQHGILTPSAAPLDVSDHQRHKGYREES
jgi:hypothetical protein